MKKNFFKKLSFVLAGAMVLSTLTPASGAFAAKAPKLNSTSKYLHLGREKENEYNFNVSNKKSGWKYEWTSANEDVATINKKNGVVKATGVGSTKVSVVITDKDGEEVDELKAKVTVRDNIATVKVSNAPTEPIAVGAEYDFNRSYVTESGSSKKTSGITRWVVDSEKATINDKGVFVATEAGDYTITANSFQSDAKYKEWLTDAKKYAGYVTATDSTKVKVAASMVEAKQIDGDTVKVTFDTIMNEEAVKANLGLSVVVGNTKVKELIKDIKLDDTGKAVDVTTYVDFTDEATYVVDYKDMESVQFVAAKREAENVASMTIDAKEAEVGEPTDIKVKLFNKDGVDITTDDLLLRVTTESDHATSYLEDREITMFNIGDIAVVKATFHTYKWNDTTGEELGNITASGAIKCVEEIVPAASGLKAWTFVEVNGGVADAADWDDVHHSLAAEDDNLRLVVKAAMTEDKDDITSDVNEDFTFTSSNEDVLFINEKTGDLYPIKAGAVVIVVKHDGKSIGAISITIGPARKAVSLTADSYAFTLSNSTLFHDTKTIELTVKDQFGEKVSLDYAGVEEANDKAYPTTFVDDTNTNTDNKITFDANGVAEGTYRFKVKANDLTRFVTVTVKNVNDNLTPTYYRAEFVDGNKFDIKLDADNTSKDVTIKIYGYNNKHVKVTDETGKTGFELEVKDVKGNVLEATAPGVYNLANTSVASAEAFKVSELGTYKVKATRTYVPEGKSEPVTQVINTISFTVEDTQKAPTASVDLRVAKDATSYRDAVLECLSFSLDGKKFTNAQEDAIDIGVADKDYIEYAGDEKAFIKNLYYNEEIGDTGSYIRHKIEVKTTIRWQE